MEAATEKLDEHHCGSTLLPANPEDKTCYW